MMLKNTILTGIFSLLVISSSVAQESGGEVLADYSDTSRVILNEQLRRTSRRLRDLEGGIPLTSGVTGLLPLANGGTGSALVDPGADRIVFWDDSEGAVGFLSANILDVTLDTISIFTSDGTWTAPQGVSEVSLTMVAGGGGGGGNNNGTTGGGGGGEYVSGYRYAVTAGNTYTIQVGLGGAGGASGSNGTNGEDSIFDTGGTSVTVDGGVAGNSDSFGGTAGTGGGLALDASGNTGGGNVGLKGGDGAQRGGGGSGLGKGGTSASGMADGDATGFGGGGAGGFSAGDAGGDGSDGLVVVIY